MEREDHGKYRHILNSTAHPTDCIILLPDMRSQHSQSHTQTVTNAHASLTNKGQITLLTIISTVIVPTVIVTGVNDTLISIIELTGPGTE